MVLMINKNETFNNLFVLELANNHWGDLDRGLEIIRQYGEVVKKHGVKAAVKLQFRDPETFIHPDFLDLATKKEGSEVTDAPGSNTRYVEKTLRTVLSEDEYKTLLDEVKKFGMVTMSTPFDEKSVDMCDRLNIEVMKIGSGTTKSPSLLSKVRDLGRPLFPVVVPTLRIWTKWLNCSKKKMSPWRLITAFLFIRQKTVS